MDRKRIERGIVIEGEENGKWKGNERKKEVIGIWKLGKKMKGEDWIIKNIVKGIDMEIINIEGERGGLWGERM